MSVAATADPSAAPQTQPASPGWHLWKDGTSIGFHDFLDAINPLQHLPLIGTVYRYLTGDEPGNAARVIGDGLYGGPIGLAAGLFNAVTRDESGHDLGEQAMAWAFGPREGDAGATAVAANDKPPAADATPPNAPTRSVAAVAALYRASDPSAAAAAPAPARSDAAPAAMRAAVRSEAIPVAAPQNFPPPIPLYRNASPAPRAAAASTTNDSPAQTLHAQTEAMQRQISITRSAAPVPLQVPSGTLFMPPARAPYAGIAASSSTIVAPTPPNDVSQKMLDALDKYSQMQQQSAPGAQINAEH